RRVIPRRVRAISASWPTRLPIRRRHANSCGAPPCSSCSGAPPRSRAPKPPDPPPCSLRRVFANPDPTMPHPTSSPALKLAVPDLISNSYFPAVAAVELGCFRREGFDVELELIFPVDRCYEALREGEIA